MSTRRHLATFGDIWRHLATFGDIWRHLATFGDIWRHLATFGDIWRHLATFGDISPKLVEIRFSRPYVRLAACSCIPQAHTFVQPLPLPTLYDNCLFKIRGIHLRLFSAVLFAILNIEYGHVHKKVALEIDFSLPKMCEACVKHV